MLLIHEALEKKGFILSEIENMHLLYNNGKLKFKTDIFFPWIAYEIFVDNLYQFRNVNSLEELIKYPVFDIGANRGYATLYFASQEWCEHVYAFELISETADLAEENYNINKNLKQKISLYKFGLAAKTGKIEAKYLPGRDGISSMNSEFLENYAPEERDHGILKEYSVYSASVILKNIIDENSLDKIIIKIDVEGAEYEIFEDLALNYPEIFDKIYKIIGDTHLGFEKYFNIVEPFGFKVIWKNPCSNNTCPFEIENTKFSR